MSPAYTHTFEIWVGGEEINGSLEFNEDGKMGFKTDEPVEVAESAKARRFINLLEELKKVFDTFGSIEKIEIKES